MLILPNSIDGLDGIASFSEVFHECGQFRRKELAEKKDMGFDIDLIGSKVRLSRLFGGGLALILFE